jgi:hypothetical protein
MHDNVQSPVQARQQIRKRAFRPFFLWLPVAGLLLAVDTHLRLLKNTVVFFRVSVENHPTETGYTAHLSSLSVLSGQRVGLGWRTFRLAVGDAEPVEKRCFLWYGRNDLGEFNLTAHKGALEISADPPPNALQITNRWFSTNLQNGTASFPTVPVGDYTVTARYDWSQEEKTIRVRRGVTSRLEIRPEVGSFDLTAQPADAEFRLTSLKQQAVTLSDRAPALVQHLPGGAYHLRVWRGDYLKESTVEIKRGETNRVTVAFEYGQVQLVSDPSGATVYAGKEIIGQTPKAFSELKPGQYRFRLEKTGHESAEVSFEVRGAESLTLRTNLVNIRYKAAMQEAWRLGNASQPDYRQALTSVSEALDSKPGEAEAMELKAKLETALTAYDAQMAEERQRAELAQRKQLASDQFSQTTDRIKDATLFDTHRWTVQGKITTVNAALLRSFDKPPMRWTMQRQTAADPTIFHCDGKGVLFGRRSCVVLTSQVSPDEVHVHAKFWDYVLGGKINLSLQGVSDDSFVPVHPRYYLPTQPGAAEKRRRELAETFWTTFQNELRSGNNQ